MLSLLLAGLALAGSPEIRGARVRTDFGKPPPWSVSVGLGGSWIFGGNADGYGGGVAERVAVGLALGQASALTLDVDHARHGVRDASAYFPDADVPAGAVSGFRDYTAVDVGLRLGWDLAEGARRDEDAVSVVPFVRLGAGVALTTTLVDVPSFDGRLPLRSQAVLPAPSLGVGTEVRIRRWFRVVPHVKAHAVLAADASELDGGERWGVEWRIQPAVDASFHF